MAGVDAAGFVGGDGVALHDTFDGGFAVDDVLVGYKGNDAQDGAVVVNDGILDAILRDTHFILEEEIAFAFFCISPTSPDRSAQANARAPR